MAIATNYVGASMLNKMLLSMLRGQGCLFWEETFIYMAKTEKEDALMPFPVLFAKK